MVEVNASEHVQGEERLQGIAISFFPPSVTVDLLWC